MPDEEYDEFKIREYSCWVLYLNQNQSYLGNCYVWLKRPGTMQRLSQLTDGELFELFRTILLQYEGALERLWRPDHINYAWLGNHMQEHGGHGHMHLIPRYERPVLFAGYGFQDQRWGSNYAPRPKRTLVASALLAIRDALRDEIR